MKRVAVVGAGFGGLALAIRLQSAGIDTVIVEARDKPGGHAYHWQRDGYTFDAGPGVVTDPNALRELWTLSGHAMAMDVELLPVSPFYRLQWPDGTLLDYSGDDAELLAQIGRMNPADVAGFRRLLDYSAAALREGEQFAAAPFLDIPSMLRAVPGLAKREAWRSVYSIVSRYIQDERLRQAFSAHMLLIGGNPMTASALHAGIHMLDRSSGVWFPKGGMNALVGSMVRLFERLGGTIRLGDAVEEVTTLGDNVTGLRTASGWEQDFDAVAANADVVHSYSLLRRNLHAMRRAERLRRKRFSPSFFSLHLGIRGEWPGIPHRTMLFGPRYEGLFEDIFKHGVLPRDLMLYLLHPTATDPDLAPEGHSIFHAVAPVPHLGKAPLDWDEVAPVYRERILDHLQRRLMPGLRDRIEVAFDYTPEDYRDDLHAHQGSAYSLEPALSQSGWFRPHNRDQGIPNLYFVGAGTHPGPGIPAVVASAKTTAALIMEDFGT